MESRKRISVLLLLSFLFAVTVAHEAPAEEPEAAAESDLDNQESSNTPQIQRRSGVFHGHHGLHYHLPASTGYAYAAKSYYTPLVKYHHQVPVYKTYAAAAPVHGHHHHVHAYARPQYALAHGGASVTSYNVNYPRYPLYRPVLKVPTTVLKPTVYTPSYAPIAPVAPIAPIAPITPVVQQKPIIPIAINPVLPTAARPIVYPQQPIFNPNILTGLNPQLIPVSVSNGAVFTNYPTFAPTPIAPSAWKPIAVPTAPTTIVQRPSISILPPLSGPASTVATLPDAIHGHHQFAQHVPSPTPVAVAAESHDHHQHFLPSGQGELNGVFNYQQQGFSSQGTTATGHTAPSNSYLGPSSYEVDLNSVQQQQSNEQQHQQHNLYHPDGGYQK